MHVTSAQYPLAKRAPIPASMYGVRLGGAGDAAV